MNKNYRSGDIISRSGDPCFTNRIFSRIALIYIEVQSKENLISLAILIDIIWIESIYEEVSKLNVIALRNMMCKKLNFNNNNFNLLKEVYVQQQDRMLDMVKLRTSSIAERLAYLIDILSIDIDKTNNILYRDQLPSLKSMAFVINAISEMISTDLSKINAKKH
jgi:hypothetical protein